MLRPTLAALLLLTATPALAEDWRFVTIDAAGEIMAFVDIDSIRATSATTRTAWMLHVQVSVDEMGVGARRYAAIVDCPARRGRVTRIVAYDMDNRQVADLQGEGEWGEMAAGTQGGDLLDFTCSHGASHPNAPSMGAAPPLADARRVMVEQRTR